MYVYVKEEGLRRRRKGSRRGKVRVMEMKGKKGKVAKGETTRPIQMCSLLKMPKSLSPQALSFIRLVTPNACLPS